MSTTNPSPQSLDETAVKDALSQTGGTATTTELVNQLQTDRLTVNIILKRLEKQGHITSYAGAAELKWEFTSDTTGEPEGEPNENKQNKLRK